MSNSHKNTYVVSRDLHSNIPKLLKPRRQNIYAGDKNNNTKFAIVMSNE